MKHILLLLSSVCLIEFVFSQTPDYSDSTITRPASYKYDAQFFGRLFLGNHYREVWAAPITMKYLDLKNMYGGLTPLKRGGGFQTKSLRMLSADSNQYVIRTIDKDPSKTVPEIFRGTIVTSAIQDQISASHPYGFLVAPELARVVGIYHTNPQILFVPDDPLLGEHREFFKGEVVLFEERLLTNADVEEGLKGFSKVKDTWDVYAAIHKNSENRVDEKFVLKNRLFDMMIGDWDRHEDQWLWAQFNNDDGTKTFRPIPRDRDQAFFNFDGILPTYASLNVATTRKMQRFKPMPLSVKWFNNGARYFDHNFLTRMSRADWRHTSDSLMLSISDEEIENAFKVWPDTVYQLTAPEIIKTLKARRNNLPLIADKYYFFLAKKVNVVGTEKSDLFEVKRLVPGQTEVSVYELKKGVKGRMYYHRTFLSTETKEIRLYGLGDEDYFSISGESGANSLLRIVGGVGSDTTMDQSKVGGLNNRTWVYDSNDGNYITGKETRDRTSSDTLFNTYSTKSFEYNFNGFFPVFGYNIDDGIYLGATVARISHGFKKLPYKTRQTFGGSVAFETGAFNFKYLGDFTDVFGKLDLNIALDVDAPNFHRNFFGFGNETIIPDSSDAEDFALRINQLSFFPAFEVGGEDDVRFLFGPVYKQARLDEAENEEALIVLPELTKDDLSRKHYIGGQAQLTYNPYTPDTMPRFVVRFLADAGYLGQAEDNTVSFFHTSGYVSMYLHFYSKKNPNPLFTLATRFGGGLNEGDYEFYQAHIIGGRTGENVRGFRGERFSGDRMFYNNLEARLRLFHFNAYIFPADFGLVGLLDNGRVWYEDEESTKLHTGYGGGIWLSPFGIAVLSATMALSDEEPSGLINVKLGWWF